MRDRRLHVVGASRPAGVAGGNHSGHASAGTEECLRARKRTHPPGVRRRAGVVQRRRQHLRWRTPAPAELPARPNRTAAEAVAGGGWPRWLRCSSQSSRSGSSFIAETPAGTSSWRALQNQPGIVVTGSQKRWGHYAVTGMRDPLAADPAQAGRRIRHRAGQPGDPLRALSIARSAFLTTARV